MSFQKLHFQGQLPPSWKSIHAILEKENFVPTIVGGIVRDYFLRNKVGHDWDIEITHPTIMFEQGLWKDLGKKLGAIGRVTFLPYNVLRLDVGEDQFEFSPPRIETFSDDNGHKNFTAEFDFSARFEQSILRRDFTINAMGIRFHSKTELEFLDPLKGLEHLRDKFLHACSPDFIKDPVRYLRALRFSIKLGFQLSSSLILQLEKMNLSGCTPSYLWSEMQKSGTPLLFYKAVLEQSNTHPELKLPVGSEALNKIEDLKNVLINETSHEAWMIALAWVGLSSDSWQSYFSLSSESSRRLARWAQSSQAFLKILPESFHGGFEDIIQDPNFNLLFDWYFTTKQLLQKNPNLPLLGMIEKYLPSWIYLYQFEVVKDVKHIDPPLRAKYQVWNLCQRL